MRWKSHVRFGERPGETDRWKQRHGAPGRFQLATTALVFLGSVRASTTSKI